MPLLQLVAGPNGAGKSTYVRDVLLGSVDLPFINADVIAAERWPGAHSEHAYQAARIAEAQRRDHLAHRRSFVTETVFSHPSKVRLVADAVAAGYLVELHVLIVPVELTVQRVAERVRRGGHIVPERKIRDRYVRLWDHVDEAIRIADMALILDNSSAAAPFRLRAEYARGSLVGRPDWPTWTPPALVGESHRDR